MQLTPKNKLPSTSSLVDPKKIPKRPLSTRPKARSQKEYVYEPPEKEVSAGGIVFRQSATGISVAMMKDSYDKWTFPKGRVEAGESFEEAGARETLEELGLQEIRFLDSLGKISIWFRDRFEKKGKLIHKDIHYYIFQTPMNARLYPDPTQHAYGAKWVPLAKVEQTSGYADLAPIIKRAIQILSHLH